MVTQHLDALVARGNTSDVYRWGKDAVVKVLRPGIPDHWAAREARTTELVHRAGLPAPAVLDVTSVDGRPGIVFERLDGVSMWERMLGHPREIPGLARLLAELQAEVNATPAPTGVPQLVDRLRSNIERASLLSAPERERVRTQLDQLPNGDALCHFDVHPNNVLMAQAQPVIIDWFDAGVGSSEADIVRASALMRYDAADGHLPCGDPSLVDFVHDEYVAAVTAIRDVDGDELLAWEQPVLAARLAEPLGDTVLDATHEMLRAGHGARPSVLAACLQATSRDTTTRGDA